MSSGIGETLSVARRQRGVTLSDAAAETRIRESYLAALESEEFAALGGDVYVKGFLRSYARFLGLEPEPLLEQYRAQHQRHEENAAPSIRPLSTPPSDRPPLVGILGAGALLLLVVVAIVGIWPDGDPASETPAVPAAVEQSPDPAGEQMDPTPDRPNRRNRQREQNAGAGASARTTAPTAEPAAERTSAPAGVPDLSEQVALTFTVDGPESWVEVDVDGANVMATVQSNGFSETWTGEEVSVVVGDAAAASVTVNGVDIGDLGDEAEVVAVECVVGAETCTIEER